MEVREMSHDRAAAAAAAAVADVCLTTPRKQIY